ncbi:MAG: alanine--glyoxylate aminotransferase family protein [Terrimicrobiaceae bacterium]|nr:alanine--glyoxylate aminotransferase family protein [Terrimicrobiaceae bacterium]
MNSIRLFIPGPVQVSEKTFRAMCQPMIGHRGSDFKALYAATQEPLRELFGTARPVFLSTSSAWGVMEGAVRNLCRRKILNCMCGAFSDKWFDVSRRCGAEAVAAQVPWGQPITPELVRAKLSEGGFDALTLIHNETSCGLKNPLREIAEVVREFPEVMFIVDCVSSFSTEAIPMDELGIDVLLTGSQKALALPPGLALFAVSERAMAKAAGSPGRGYYFDFEEFEKNAQGSMTPSTPAISLIYALRSKLEDILAEGIQRRFERHARLNAMVHEWVRSRGFGFFAPEGFRSVSLTCAENTKGVDVAAWLKRLRAEHGFVIDGGYGKLKGLTFRISNMGDTTDEEMRELLAALDASL